MKVVSISFLVFVLIDAASASTIRDAFLSHHKARPVTRTQLLPLSQTILTRVLEGYRMALEEIPSLSPSEREASQRVLKDYLIDLGTRLRPTPDDYHWDSNTDLNRLVDELVDMMAHDIMDLGDNNNILNAAFREKISRVFEHHLLSARPFPTIGTLFRSVGALYLQTLDACNRESNWDQATSFGADALRIVLHGALTIGESEYPSEIAANEKEFLDLLSWVGSSVVTTSKEKDGEVAYLHELVPHPLGTGAYAWRSVFLMLRRDFKVALPSAIDKAYCASVL